jgi:hypothetical protein
MGGYWEGHPRTFVRTLCPSARCGRGREASAAGEEALIFPLDGLLALVLEPLKLHRLVDPRPKFGEAARQHRQPRLDYARGLRHQLFAIRRSLSRIIDELFRVGHFAHAVGVEIVVQARPDAEENPVCAPACADGAPHEKRQMAGSLQAEAPAPDRCLGVCRKASSRLSSAGAWPAADSKIQKRREEGQGRRNEASGSKAGAAALT